MEQLLQSTAGPGRELLDNVSDAVAILDCDWRCTYVNSRAEALVHIPKEKLIGSVLWNVFPEVVTTPSYEHFQHAMRAGVHTRFEASYASNQLWVEVDAYPNAGGLMLFVRDITGRKQAENERALLLAREQEARETAELLNRVGPMLAAELDLQKLVQSVTDIATKLTGADFGSFFHNVIDRNGESYMLYTLSGASREAFKGFPMPRNTEVFGPTFRGEGVVRSDDIKQDPRYGKNPPYFGMPNGHLPVRSYLAASVVSRSGEVLGGLFFGHSMPAKFTERHEAIVTGIAAQAAIAMDNARLFERAQWVQNELKRSNEELRRANQDLETFAYSASHDLQEPLRNIAIAGQLLKRSRVKELQGDSPRLLDEIVQGAFRMETLIRDLLSYTRATKYAEGPPPRIESGAVLADILQNLRTQIDQNNATVTSTDLPAVLMHEVHLAQVFQNLIANALKYRSTQAPHVHISAAEQDNWWVFSVADNGIGIDPAYANQIFGLFKRLHTQSEYPGSGIGLAICQRILEQYGGRIWLDKSAPGAGSVFCFAIPVRKIH